MKLINIGFGNLIVAERVIAVISPESAPVKRMVQESKDCSRCIDATHGRKTKSVIVTDSDHVILSSLHPETLMSRFCEEKGTGKSAKEETAL